MNNLVNIFLLCVMLIDLLAHSDWIFSVSSWLFNSNLVNRVCCLGRLKLVKEMSGEGLMMLVISALVINNHLLKVTISLESMIFEFPLELAIGESAISVLSHNSLNFLELFLGCSLLRSRFPGTSRESNGGRLRGAVAMSVIFKRNWVVHLQT